MLVDNNVLMNDAYVRNRIFDNNIAVDPLDGDESPRGAKEFRQGEVSKANVTPVLQ